MTAAQMIKKALKAYYPNETFSCRMKKESATVTWDNEVGQTEVQRIIENMNFETPIEYHPTRAQQIDEPASEIRYKFNAITTDSHECHKCGKTELKKVVMVEMIDADGNGTGDITPMGTTCAAKALGMSKKYKTPEAIEAALDAKAESKADYEKAVESAKKQAAEHNDHVAVVKVSGQYTAVRERALNANPHLYGIVYKWIAPEPTDVTPHPEMQVKHYNICTTNQWIFKTIEPSPKVDGMPGGLHSGIQFVEHECWGDVTTRRAPAALQSLPPMTSERSEAFRKWYQGLYQISLDAIFGKYPHLKETEHIIRDGEVIVISETDPTLNPSLAVVDSAIVPKNATRAPEYGNDTLRVKCENEAQYQEILSLDGQGIEIICGEYPFIILQPVLTEPDEIKVGDYITNSESPRYGGFVFRECQIPTVNKNGKVVDGEPGYECRLDSGGKRWISKAVAVKAEPKAEIQTIIDEAQQHANSYNDRITIYHEFHEYGYVYSGYAYATKSEWKRMEKRWLVDKKTCGRDLIVEIFPK